MTTTNSKTEFKASGNAVSQVQTVTAIPSVMDARTTEQLNQTLMLMERHATDLVASDVVRTGYMSHGHPAQLGFQHLSTMTNSRLKKRFPLFNKEEPLMHILWVQGRVIVGEEIVKKYEARRDGKTYDYAKSIDRRFDKMFKDLDKYKDLVKELQYEDKK